MDDKRTNHVQRFLLIIYWSTASEPFLHISSSAVVFLAGSVREFSVC
jgi:hypothetical protein